MLRFNDKTKTFEHYVDQYSYIEELMNSVLLRVSKRINKNIKLDYFGIVGSKDYAKYSLLIYKNTYPRDTIKIAAKSIYDTSEAIYCRGAKDSIFVFEKVAQVLLSSINTKFGLVREYLDIILSHELGHYIDCIYYDTKYTEETNKKYQDLQTKYKNNMIDDEEYLAKYFKIASERNANDYGGLLDKYTPETLAQRTILLKKELLI